MGEPIDFAAILANVQCTGEDERWNVGTSQSEALLAAKVPELCPDCIAGTRPIDLTTCTHPNAPTIGRMLAEWRPLMALAGWAQHYPGCESRTSPYHPHVTCTCGLNAARAALQEVLHG